VLSPREREVLQLVAEGFGNRGIAERLFISIKTVEAHKEHIVQKLGVRGNAELIRYAIRKGLVTIETDADIGINSKTG
jgi:DNA-binding NarL/FixJ family response regulator